MSFDARVYRILIASPGDVGEERSVIPEVINDWNAVSSFQTKLILMPVRWETHSAPLMSNRPQAIINEQLVKECDLLVGVFWSRIGTHTGVSVSGTAEEIEQFVAQNKPVMLYFSQSPIDPDKIELAQFTVLRNFKEKMRLKGLTESYAGIPDFRQKFSRQLGINLNGLIEKIRSQAQTKGNTHTAQIVRSTINKPPRNSPLFQATQKPNKNQLDDYLIKAATSAANHEGWANMAAIGAYLRTYTPVDYRDYGFPTLKRFLKSTGLFEVKEEKKSPNAKALDSSSIRLLHSV